MRQYITLLLLSSMLALLNTSCKKNPTEPELPEPGRRDYVWTVDTLDPGVGKSFDAEYLYGETPDDIWAVGYGTGKSALWHYDGKNWTEGEMRFLATNNILGFSKDDIWICGGNSFWHYNGRQWARYPNIVPPGYTNVDYMAMAGTGSDNIYAVGVSFERDRITPKSSVAHFNGSEWKLIDIQNLPVANAYNIELEKTTGKYFIVSVDNRNNTYLYRIHLLQGNSVKEVFSSTKSITINYMNGECYFAAAKKLYKYRDDSMQIWKDLSGTNYLGLLWERSEADIFTMNDGALGHYNGRDMIDIFKTDLWVRNGVLFENEVFFICVHPERYISYIIHGKLK